MSLHSNSIPKELYVLLRLAKDTKIKKYNIGTHTGHKRYVVGWSWNVLLLNLLRENCICNMFDMKYTLVYGLLRACWFPVFIWTTLLHTTSSVSKFVSKSFRLPTTIQCVALKRHRWKINPIILHFWLYLDVLLIY